MSKASEWLEVALKEAKSRPELFAMEMADPDSAGTLTRQRKVVAKPINSFGRPAMTLSVGRKDVFSAHAADAVHLARWILDTFGEK